MVNLNLRTNFVVLSVSSTRNINNRMTNLAALCYAGQLLLQDANERYFTSCSKREYEERNLEFFQQ